MRNWALGLGIVAVALGAGVAALAPWWLGLVVAGAIGAGGWFGFVGPLVRGADRRALRLVGPARDADVQGEARLLNLVDGLALGTGIGRPRCLVIDDPAVNALALGQDPRHGCIIVTAGLLARLSRMELEGVVAQLLVSLRDGATVGPTLALSLGRRGGNRQAAGEVQGAAAADLGAVALTRYPPGLSSALQSIIAAGPSVPAGAARALDPLWLAPPGAQERLAARVGVLDEL